MRQQSKGYDANILHTGKHFVCYFQILQQVEHEEQFYSSNLLLILQPYLSLILSGPLFVWCVTETFNIQNEFNKPLRNVIKNKYLRISLLMFVALSLIAPPNCYDVRPIVL